MDHSHSVDCTISQEVEICCCDQNRYPLSPCSSSETLMTLASLQPSNAQSNVTAATEQSVILEPKVVVRLPNLVDKWEVTVAEVEEFVKAALNQDVEVTVLHLLIYLYSRLNEGPEYINQVKLLHAGKQYNILRKSDLSRRTPLLHEVSAQYATFQLIIADELRCQPLSLLNAELLQQATLYYTQLFEAGSVTYAEALFKLIKKLTASLKTDLSNNRKNTVAPDQVRFKSTFKRVFKIRPARIAT